MKLVVRSSLFSDKLGKDSFWILSASRCCVVLPLELSVHLLL